MSVNSQYDAIAAAQKKALLANLTTQKTSALSDLDAENAKINPAYQAQANAAAAQNAIGAKNFAEYMAGNGLSAGTGAQFDMMNLASLQGNLGTLGAQQAADQADIERRRTGVMNTFEGNLESGNENIDAQTLEKELAARQRSRLGGGGGAYTYKDPVTGMSYKASSYNNFLYDTALQQKIMKDEQNYKNRPTTLAGY